METVIDVHGEVAEIAKPRVLVVDNSASAVERIIHQLKQHQFDVRHAVNKESAKQVLETSVCDLALVDINLDDPHDPLNRDGVAVAEHIAKVAPETKVIFISIPRHLGVDLLLTMFNRNPQGRSRLAEAYVNKGDTLAVVGLARSVLHGYGSDSKVVVAVDSESWAAMRRDLDLKVSSTVGDDLIEGSRQTLQVLRQLAIHELMPLASVSISRMGGGRSRTMVVSMTAEYKPISAEYCTVVKIGARDVVESERRNYVQWVPSFVEVVGYPEMTGYAASRQLSGIGYRMIGRAHEPAHTFAGRYWEAPEEESIMVLKTVFQSFLVPKKAPRPAPHGQTLRNEYSSRFRRLLATTLDADVDQRAKEVGIEAAGRTWRISGVASDLARPTDVYNEQFLTGFRCAVAHGDLHGENIIVHGDNNDRRTFLIDFAHIGEHHVYLDYAVMEVSVRIHLLADLLRRTPETDLANLVERWLRIEEWLIDRTRDMPRREAIDIQAMDDSLARLVRLLIWLRTTAWQHGFADSYYSYYGAVGMATLTAIFLPLDEPSPVVANAIHRVVLGCSALCMTHVKSDLLADPDRSPLSAALCTAAASDSFAAEVLSANVTRIRHCAMAQCTSFAKRADASARELALAQALHVVDRLDAVVPRLSDEIRRVISETDLRRFAKDLLPAAQVFVAFNLLEDLELSALPAQLTYDVADVESAGMVPRRKLPIFDALTDVNAWVHATWNHTPRES